MELTPKKSRQLCVKWDIEFRWVIRLKSGDDIILAGLGDLEGGRVEWNTLYPVKTKVGAVRASVQEFDLESHNKKGPCHGDSGGPAFVDRDGVLLLVGATSRNSDGKRDVGQGTYTDVTRY